MIIAVDFDGTLHLGKYPEIGIPTPDAVKYMRKLHADGHYIIINTCRDRALLLDAVNWLLERGIPFSRVNDNTPANSAKYGGNSRKVFADMYVDDRQVGGLPTWAEIYKYISAREAECTT